MTLQIGTKLTNYGPGGHGAITEAKTAEAVGFDSVWVTDRLVTLSRQRSRYPYTPDGALPWREETPFYEPLTVLAGVAAVTTTIRLATGVLILPLRQPFVLAKQTATLAALSQGRLILGIGAGWMHEEFDLVGKDFQDRASLTREIAHILRECWTGRPRSYTTRHHQVPTGLSMYPAPPIVPPLLVGGNSDAALRLAGTIGSGWYGLFSAGQAQAMDLDRRLGVLRQAVSEAGHDVTKVQVVLRLAGSVADVVPLLVDVMSHGVTQVVVDTDLTRTADAARDLAVLRRASGQSGSPHVTVESSVTAQDRTPT